MAAYNIHKRNGQLLTTIVTNTVDTTSTDLTLLGRNVASYGEIMAENLVYLLENFASDVAPNNPLKGQLWYKTTVGDSKLQVYDGANWISFGASVETVAPTTAANGDIWVDTTANQLKTFLDGSWTVVGPTYHLDNKSNKYTSTYTGHALIDDTAGTTHNCIVSIINGRVEAVITNEIFTVAVALPTADQSSGPILVPTLDTRFNVIMTAPNNAFTLTEGLNLISNTDFLLFPSQVVTKANNTDNLGGTAASKFARRDVVNHFINTNTFTQISRGTASASIGTSAAPFAHVYGTMLHGTATTALYADVAERYEIDAPSQPGHIVELGGNKEICLTSSEKSRKIVGVISTDPALTMNNNAGDDETHPPVALLGRVPCLIVGTACKGDQVVSSHIRGVGMAVSVDEDVPSSAVVGKLLHDKTSDDVELVEIVVGVK